MHVAQRGSQPTRLRPPWTPSRPRNAPWTPQTSTLAARVAEATAQCLWLALIPASTPAVPAKCTSFLPLCLTTQRPYRAAPVLTSSVSATSSSRRTTSWRRQGGGMCPVTVDVARACCVLPRDTPTTPEARRRTSRTSSSSVVCLPTRVSADVCGV